VSWRQNNSGMPWLPVQFDEVVNHSNTWDRKDTSTNRPGALAGAAPGDEQSLGADQEQVRDRRQSD